MVATTTPPPDVIETKCRMLGRTLSACIKKEDLITPCEPEKMTKALWKRKCGRTWKKLDRLARRYDDICDSPIDYC